MHACSTPPTDWRDGLVQQLTKWLLESVLQGEIADHLLGALLVSAERSLAAEFPPQAQARLPLAAVGSGERTFTNIACAVGGIGVTPLQRVLELLTDKRIVAAELPVWLRPSKDRRDRGQNPTCGFGCTCSARPWERSNGGGRSDASSSGDPLNGEPEPKVWQSGYSRSPPNSRTTSSTASATSRRNRFCSGEAVTVGIGAPRS